LGICEFESSEVSQPVRRLETLPSITSEMPANGGILRVGYQSPCSEIGLSGREIADSLRLLFEIFPFSGRQRPETGFDRDYMAEPAVLSIRQSAFTDHGETAAFLAVSPSTSSRSDCILIGGL